MSVVSIPNTVATRARRGWIWYAIPIAAVVAVASMALTWSQWFTRGGDVQGAYYSVTPMSLDVKVVKDGELQAINNIDVVCQVEGQNTITQIVPEGSFVKKGDVVVVLDSSQIRLKVEDAQLDLVRLAAQAVEDDLVFVRGQAVFGGQFGHGLLGSAHGRAF